MITVSQIHEVEQRADWSKMMLDHVSLRSLHNTVKGAILMNMLNIFHAEIKRPINPLDRNY